MLPDMNNKLYTLKDFLDLPDKNIYETADYFQNYIDQLDNKYHAYGFNTTTTTSIGAHMDIFDRYSKDKKETISFISNNYLGMNKHPKVIQAAHEAIEKYGIGTCAAPPIGGYIDIHAELEEKIAKLHSKEDAILYTSGYSANIGVYQLFLTKYDLAVIDMYVHASVYDGLGKTNVKIFKHNDMNYLEMVLKQNQGKHRNMVVIVDGVYSQDGDLANLPDICDLAEKYGALVFVDDAHGAGVLGENGKGTLTHFGVEDRVDLVTGTFSKSMGTVGGYATGSKQLIKYMRHYSRSNTFSAALAPPIAKAASKAIDLFSEEPEIIEKLWRNTKYAKERLITMGVDIGASESPITPIMIRDDLKTILMARRLFEEGVFVIPAVYPAVKLKNSRFRFGLTSEHSIEDINFFCDKLDKVLKE
jgi:glycine C-acetyltransferase